MKLTLEEKKIIEKLKYEYELRIVLLIHVYGYVDYIDNIKLKIFDLFTNLFDITIDKNNQCTNVFHHVLNEVKIHIFLHYLQITPLCFYSSLKNVLDINIKRQREMNDYLFDEKFDENLMNNVPSSNDISESTIGRFKYIYPLYGAAKYKTRENIAIPKLNHENNDYILILLYLCKNEKMIDLILTKCIEFLPLNDINECLIYAFICYIGIKIVF